MPTDQDGEQFNAERIDRIDLRRSEAVGPEDLDESKRETIVESSEQVASLKMQVKHLEGMVSPDLPNVYFNDESGQTQSRKPTLNEALSWLNDGTLAGYLERELKIKYPDKTERQLRIIVAQKTRYLQKAQEISSQVTKIDGRGEKKQWQELTEPEQLKYLEQAEF